MIGQWFALGLLICVGVKAAPSNPIPPPTDITPSFRYVAEGWLPSPQMLVMDAYWANAGLLARGKNYWLTGGPKCGNCKLWERFNPDSDLFQSWMGVFVLKSFEFTSEWDAPTPAKVKKSARRVMQIAATSQAVWLQKQGIPTAKAEVVPKSIRVTDWSDGYLRVVAKVATQCDLGEENPKRSFIPRFNEKLQAKLGSFQPIELTYQALMKYLPASKHFVVVYTALPTVKQKNGHVHTPSPRVLWDLGRMANAVTFE